MGTGLNSCLSVGTLGLGLDLLCGTITQTNRLTMLMWLKGEDNTQTMAQKCFRM